MQTEHSCRPTVLIVEDEDVLRLTFEQFLTDEGHCVHVAADFDEAVACLDEVDIDVIVSDIILGGKTGIDLLKVARDEQPQALVIMITGEPSVKTASETVRLGAFDYLQKPVTGPNLQRIVRFALKQRRVTRERDQFAARMDQYRRDLDAIFNSVNAAIVMVGRDMTIRQWNNAAKTLLNLKDSESNGMSFDEIFPDELADARDALHATLSTRKPVDNIRFQARLGSQKPKVLALNTVPLVDENGIEDGAVLIARDITRLTLLERQLEEQEGFHNIIGRSPKMRDVFQLIEDLSETDTTALICGESGTGKELVAEALHKASGRAGKPLVTVNCVALSEEILESELFGHVKGAFTGAIRDRKGRFETADGGTIFLDEIGNISLRSQLRLLRVVQEGEFERVGDSTPLKCDVRIIAATNQSLPDKIAAGEFREDLYYRLNVVRIEVPPLRERREDVPLIVKHLCRRFNTAFNKEIQGLSDEATRIFMEYPWPGNVRELENCVERAFIVCHDSVIRPEHLPSEVARPELRVNSARACALSKVPPASLTREAVLDALHRTDWNVAKSARLLGISRNSLYQKIRSFNLTRPASS